MKKTVNHYFVYIIALFLTQAVWGQSIQGVVKDQSGQPIPFVSVSVLNKSLGTVTNTTGQYTLAIPAGQYNLTFSATGYASVSRTVSVGTAAAPLDIVLEPVSTSLGAVVVTANKREENLLQVPVAVTSLSAKKLQDTRTWGLGGLTAIVPNYSYHELGVAFQQVQSIRGIQTFSENPAVATYIDDVNNLDILANGFALTDIERIEVLRGPQGTLFGRNAMGGVVNIITKKPTNQPRGFAEISLGNLGLQRYAAGFGMPIVKDKLFFGLNGLYQQQDGYWTNDTTGTFATDGSVQGKKVGGDRNLYGNMYLRWIPSTRFQATLNVKAQQDKSDNTGFFVSQRDYDKAFSDPDIIALTRIGDHDRDIVNTALMMKYFTRNFTLTSISAYQTIRLGFGDIDFPGIYFSFADKVPGEQLPPQKVFSQELRISSNTDNRRLQYTAGLYGFTQKGYEPSSNTAYELSDGEAAFFGFPPGSYIISRNVGENKGIAAYGEISYALTPKLKATAGLRYDYEDRSATFNGFFDAYFLNDTVNILKPDTSASGSYSALSPKLALSYSPTALSQVYLSYTRGFRAGGVNPQRYPAGSGVEQTFDPEYSDNFELGYKLGNPKGTFRMTAALFYISWKDLQFFNLAAPFTYARSNVGDASSYGLELEGSWIPVKGLQVDASLGLNKTEYGDFDIVRQQFGQPEVVTPIGGNSLSNAPSHTIFLGVQYTVPVTKKIDAMVRGEFRNLGAYYTDIQNTLRQPAYSLLNARAGLTMGKFGLYVWGQNLTNTTYLAFGTADTSFGTSVRTAAPITYGFTLQAGF